MRRVRSRRNGMRLLGWSLGVWFVVVGVAAALEAGVPLPKLDAIDLQGERHTWASLRGNVVLVDFWASWCKPCREEMPVLQELQDKYRDRGFVVLGVNLDSDRKAMMRLVKETGVTFPVLHEEGMKLAERFSPPKMPSSYLVGRDGKLIYVHEGFRKSDVERIEALIKRALAIPAAP